MLKQGLGDGTQGSPALLDDFAGTIVLLIDDALDGRIDFLGSGLAEILGAVDFLAQEDVILVFAESDWSEVTHTPVTDHVTGYLGGLLDIIGRPVAVVLGLDFLAEATGHGAADLVDKMLP